MKTTRVLSSLGLLVALTAFLSFTGCMKNSAKNATLKMTASAVKTRGTLKSALTSGPIQLSSGTLELTSANINISNLQIEENSGNDVEQQGGDQQLGGTDKNEGAESKNEGTDGKEGKDSEDILLQGPFSLDISGGEAVIGQVDVYPGTFKKVDFSFQVNSNAPFNGHSIAINGSYVATNGSKTPFILYSDFAKQIQLPLANGGITLQSNSTVSISIVFDLNNWLGSLDFQGAATNNGQIVIDNMNNASMLTAFETKVAGNIDIENN